MAAEIPDDIPLTLAAGDSWRWRWSWADYPAGDGWALAVRLIGPTEDDIVAPTATADGDAFDVVTAKTDTADLTAGTYRYVARVTLGDEAHTVASGTVPVTANLETATAADLLTHEERAVPLLETAIERRVTVDLASYTITNRQATREELNTLVALLARYKAILARRANGGRLPPVLFGFGGRA